MTDADRDGPERAGGEHGTPAADGATGATSGATNGATNAARSDGAQGTGSAPATGGNARARARREVSAGGVVFRMAPGDDGAPRALFLLIRDSYRNWGFPKGHLERGEEPDAAALREVREETGLAHVELRGAIETIDWYFRFRGRLIHKVCHFFLMETTRPDTSPQRAEGITACRWAPFEEAVRVVSYANAREVLRRAQVMVSTTAAEPTASAPRTT